MKLDDYFARPDTPMRGSPVGETMQRLAKHYPDLSPEQLHSQALRSHSRAATNDTHDIDRAELKLIRVGHYLWRELRRARKSLKSDLLSECEALEEAIQTIAGLKRIKRAELKAERAVRNAEVAERLRPKAAAV